ncbi:pyridoxamine 5'-phosphate oxidase family protein [Clostridium sp. DJ247]|uniref:pyridoxamine 5'-phosphate oxidase family protein n=1 Tax=Clostridium sp. DJ247 TaxID=2726188 RepID=UPI00162A0F72|nr:pyridoxamine 5'-phosphate oxidase family protein [Clostridium sp. DJ247]MBC2582180.1 pyridoxamine 5'-phosphate oxidase family protein [Clostridium sp. DJ247]
MDIKEKILDVVKKHNLMYVGTVDEKGLPKVRSVDYVVGENESVLYFVTYNASDKVKEIKTNNNVFIVIDHDCNSIEELQELKYIRATGKAYISENPKEIQKAFELLLQKFPFMKDLPGDPSSFVVIRVELHKVTLTDNTIHFAYTEEVSYR